MIIFKDKETGLFFAGFKSTRMPPRIVWDAKLAVVLQEGEIAQTVFDMQRCDYKGTTLILKVEQ